ncbi:hypothetical protein GQ600_17790 [Phytophthora cactorum]|nr:hypothetical protein GQ600_17790 [Phytophthora cactorum]
MQQSSEQLSSLPSCWPQPKNFRRYVRIAIAHSATPAVHPHRSYCQTYIAFFVTMSFTIQSSALLVAMLAVIVAFAPSISAESFAGTIIYTGKDCSGTPLVVSVIGSVDCEAVECVLFIADSVTYSSETICERADRQAYVASTFAGSSYVLVETYSKMCTWLGKSRNLQRQLVFWISVSRYEPDNETVSSHSCYNNYSVIYTSDGSSFSGSGSQITATNTSVLVSTRSTSSNSGSSVADDDSSYQDSWDSD